MEGNSSDDGGYNDFVKAADLKTRPDRLNYAGAVGSTHVYQPKAPNPKNSREYDRLA